MSNELLLKILDLASIMTYAEVGKHLSDKFELSKFSIWKVIQNTVIETYYDREINRGNLKVHVQIDEKFINLHAPKKRDDKCKNKRKKTLLYINNLCWRTIHWSQGKEKIVK